MSIFLKKLSKRWSPISGIAENEYFDKNTILEVALQTKIKPNITQDILTLDDDDEWEDF